jgi:serine/threonine-protein kinase
MVGDIEPGVTLDERFSILELIDQGGMASVFKAMDLTTGRMVAVKVPFFALESSPAFYTRFQREREIGARLDHPGIVSVLPVEQPSRLYLAMEYVDGETLWDRLVRERPLPLPEAIRIAQCACEAVGYLHRQGIVHRDLKPGNVMLGPRGAVKIMDFGLASAVGRRRLTTLGGRVGTAGYIAPEQVRGRHGDARVDLYSLGAILYEMTTGHSIYDEQPDEYTVMTARLSGDPIPPRRHNAAISPQLEEIILRALERRPGDRYGSTAEMQHALAHSDLVPLTGRVSRLRPPKPVTRGWRVARLVVAALLLPIVLFFVLFLALRH